MKEIDKNPWWKPGLVIFTKVSASIAIPVVLALYIGQYLDNKYQTAPWIFLSLIFVAFLISIFSIWKSIKKYIKSLEKESQNKINYDNRKYK